MKRITLAVLSLVAASAVGVAQEPPTPPVRPAPAPRPAPVAPVPDVGPVTPVAPVAPVPMRDFDYLDRDHVREMQRQAQDLAREMSRMDQEQTRELQRQAQEMARESVRLNQDHINEMVREASRVDAQQLRDQAQAMAHEFAYAMPMDFQHIAPMPMPAPVIAPMPPMALMAPMALSYVDSRDFTNRPAPAGWIQGDPADSLYGVAREALNSGDYGRAARLFNELVAKYQKSRYQDAGQYYEALARYKIGTTDELHQAAKILEPMVAKIPPRPANSDGRDVRQGGGAGYGCGGFGCSQVVFNNRSGFSDSEVAALYNRVLGALAQRGDREAGAKLEEIGKKIGNAPCDRDDIDVRTEALNALSQMDAATSLPILKRVLERKDDCSAQLRRSAVFMLGRRSDADAANLLITTAKSDPNVDVRIAAINYLGKLPGDAGLSALDDMLKNDQDERIQRAVVRALNSSDNPRARSGMRSLIDRKDAPMNLRLEAINSLASDRTTNDDAAYLRGLYAKADNDRMKDAIISSLSRLGGAENEAFVLNVAKNPNESSQIRSSALSRLSRSPTVTAADLGKMYDAADNYDMRSRIVQILGSRKDPESADKLIDIAKNSTVASIRKEALQSLIRRNDPRATQLLNDIIDGKKP